MDKRERSPTHLEDIVEDGLLCSMVSSWPLRDAIRTSIISRRWKHIWKYIPNLDFDANMLGCTAVDTSVDGIDMEARDALLRERTEKFIKSVEVVLEHHKGSGVDLFRINYFLKDTHAYFLDTCVCFAIASKTKELVLELYTCFKPLPTDKPYNFPCHFFTNQRGSSIERLYLNFCSLKPDSSFNGFCYLKVLDLDRVDISEEGISNFLSNCFTLEKLSVKMCCTLVNLKISQPLGQLNYLTVESCAELKKIDFHAIKLNTFRYVGRKVDIILGASSLLKEAYITLQDFIPVQRALARFPSSLPCLQTLLFEFAYIPMRLNLSQVHSRFFHLKHLILVPFLWNDSEKVYALSLYHFLNAAPFLEKFEVHLQSGPISRYHDFRKRPRAFPHNHLRSVVISGFSGSVGQLELVMFLFDIATGLKVMKIDQRRKFYIHPGQFKELERYYVHHQILKIIRHEAPKNIKLIFLNST